MSIVGAIIGMPIGGMIGLFTPVILNDVYPKTWSDSYKNNGAIIVVTCIGGIVGGSISGAIIGHISNKSIIPDYGILGGVVGGVVGGLAGGTFQVYSNYNQDTYIKSQ